MKKIPLRVRHSPAHAALLGELRELLADEERLGPGIDRAMLDARPHFLAVPSVSLLWLREELTAVPKEWIAACPKTIDRREDLVGAEWNERLPSLVRFYLAPFRGAWGDRGKCRQLSKKEQLQAVRCALVRLSAEGRVRVRTRGAFAWAELPLFKGPWNPMKYVDVPVDPHLEPAGDEALVRGVGSAQVEPGWKVR